MIDSKSKTYSAVPLILAVCFLSNITTIEILGECGHTKAHQISCPVQLKCSDKNGKGAAACGDHEQSFNPQPGKFGSEGCGSCNTEATISSDEALCSYANHCSYTAGICALGGGNPFASNRTIQKSPKCPGGG